MHILQAICHTRMEGDCGYLILLPYYPAMQMSPVKEKGKVDSQAEVTEDKPYLYGSQYSRFLCLSHSYVKQAITRKLPFSLIRSLIDCHFISYGMLLMKTLLRLIVFFSPVPVFFSFV